MCVKEGVKAKEAVEAIKVEWLNGSTVQQYDSVEIPLLKREQWDVALSNFKMTFITFLFI